MDSSVKGGNVTGRLAETGNPLSAGYLGIVKESLVRLSPRRLLSNPVMLAVELSFFLTLILSIFPGLIPKVTTPSEQPFYMVVAVILFVTVWFSTLSDSIAEAQIRATASSLRKIEQEVTAIKLDKDRNPSEVSSKDLRKGDIIMIRKGDHIPIDCEVLEGIGMVDESLVTGESDLVQKAPTDSLIGGSILRSDTLIAMVSANPGETYLSRLIAIVESSKRPKTPNETAISILLLGLTIGFTIIVAVLLWFSVILHLGVDLSVLLALYVCLLPTTIGALLPAIGISGINRMSSRGIIAKSGKAIEAAGDTDTLLLDKTGTITYGNRTAVAYIPIGGHTEREVGEAAFLSSWNDDTPEGRSIIDLSFTKGYFPREFASIDRAEAMEFSAATRMSSVKLEDADEFVLPKGGKGILQRRRMRRKYIRPDTGDEIDISKGAPDAIRESVPECPSGYDDMASEISASGDTAMAVAVGTEIVGFIRLRDRVKSGIRAKIEDVEIMGITPVMITGDQELTARKIGSEVGIDRIVSQAKPETKMLLVTEEQKGGKIVSMLGDGTNDAPALAVADVGLAMASGTMAAKEAANLVDLESSPGKIIDVVMMGKQLLMTRGAVTTFSIANDLAKYFAIVPVMFSSLPDLQRINILGLSPHVAVLAALIFNAIIIPLLIPLAMRGARFRPRSTMSIFLRNAMIYGFGGILLPFAGIEAIGILLNLIPGGIV
ncbi:MAG: HAD-IC family P-type ATPase [Candidatus Thermoplasmatota archaeon]|nr:HAD-IC family P-type ATPase [Candidatus Thermoplasmatota archaeon]